MDSFRRYLGYAEGIKKKKILGEAVNLILWIRQSQEIKM